MRKGEKGRGRVREVGDNERGRVRKGRQRVRKSEKGRERVRKGEKE